MFAWEVIRRAEFLLFGVLEAPCSDPPILKPYPFFNLLIDPLE
jgi:hypothetical protein